MLRSRPYAVTNAMLPSLAISIPRDTSQIGQMPWPLDTPRAPRLHLRGPLPEDGLSYSHLSWVRAGTDGGRQYGAHGYWAS